MFQALDQFEVEKLGREVRRGQTENTRQGYRNGGRAQQAALAKELHTDNGEERERIAREVSDVEQRIERQLAAIESGVDPVLVGERIRALKGKREVAEAALAELEADDRQNGAVDLKDACAVLDGIPDLGEALAEADPKQRRAVFDAFRLSVEIDRNTGRLRLKALDPSAFSQVRDLKSLVASGGIAGAGFERIPLPAIGSSKFDTCLDRAVLWSLSQTVLQSCTWPVTFRSVSYGTPPPPWCRSWRPAND